MNKSVNRTKGRRNTYSTNKKKSTDANAVEQSVMLSKNTQKTQNTQADNAGKMKEDITMKTKTTQTAQTTAAQETKSIEGATQNEKYMWLNNSELQISPDIQRKLSPMRVSEITANFSPLVANPIKVSFRDGKYYIFDGMHTRTAMCDLHGTDSFPIFCRVYYGLSKEDEARLFAAQFGISEAVPMGYRLRALAVAKDPEVLDFLKITRDSGFAITLGSRLSCNGRISASCQAFKAYRELGGNEYGKMLKILHRTWAGDSWSVSKYMLGGMARFMKMYEVRANSFVKAFREVSKDEIVSEAMRFKSMTKDGAYATALAEIYDRNSTGTLRDIA